MIDRYVALINKEKIEIFRRTKYFHFNENIQYNILIEYNQILKIIQSDIENNIFHIIIDNCLFVYLKIWIL